MRRVAATPADLARVRSLAGDLGRLELEAARARVELYRVVRELAGRGVMKTVLAEAAGVSHQRVSQIVAERL